MKIIHKDEVAPKDTSHHGGDIKGVTLKELITSKDGAQNFSLRLFEIEPFGNTPFHTHAWEHEVYIISGGGKIKREADSVDITPGTAIFIPAKEKHSFVAEKQGLSFICAIPSEQKSCLDK
jgi:quercetin dioxygenase-like cupin family protein